MPFHDHFIEARQMKFKRPDRHKRERKSQARERLSEADILELMGVKKRGMRRRRGAWRRA